MKTSKLIVGRPVLSIPSRKRLGWTLGMMVGLVATLSTGAPSDVDLTFDPGSRLDGQVKMISLQSDGKAVIAGEFHTLQGMLAAGVARLNTNGVPDQAFLGGKHGVGERGQVECLTVLTNDQVLIGGWFNSVNGVARTNLARLNADGSVDETLAVTCAGDYVTLYSLTVQPDGKIILVGTFDFVNGIARTNIARITQAGSLDETFAPVFIENDSAGEPYFALLQTDGKVIVGGAFTSINSVARTNLVRLNQDGSLDETFTTELQIDGERAYPSCVALDPDSKILVGGGFTSVNGIGRTNIARLNEDGSLDESFSCTNTPAGGDVWKILAQPGGKILCAGYLFLDADQPMNFARFNYDGSVDNSFQPLTYDGVVDSFAVAANGGIIIAGSFWEPFGASRYIIRVQPDGTRDDAYDCNREPTGPSWAVNSLFVQEGGRIVMAGEFHSVNKLGRDGCARLNPDGSLDETFAPSIGGSYPHVRCLAGQTDGKILIGGNFDLVNGEIRNGIARLNPDGTLDPTFTSVSGLGGTDSGVEAIAVQTNGQVLIGGWFSLVNGEPRYSLARLNADGSLDAGFTNNPIGGRPVRAILLQHDGKVVIGGGLPLQLTRFNADGTRDLTFASTATEVFCLAEQPDGKILVGGHFQENGVAWNGIARLLPDGTHDDSFLKGILGPEGFVFRLALDADGKILVAGDFTLVNGIPRKYLARLNPDGSLDLSFNVDLHSWNSAVSAIAIQPDTKILLGGYFTAVNGTPRSFVTRLMGSVVPPWINNPPQDSTAEAGGGISITVAAGGYPSVSYQWFFHETNLLADATNATLRLANLDFADIGAYSVVVSNAGGTVTSTPALLNVISAVTRRLVPGLLLPGATGGQLNLEVSAALGPAASWNVLAAVQTSVAPSWWFDLAEPLPEQRFYRAQVVSGGRIPPVIQLGMVPALMLTGNMGDLVRVDAINVIGPTDAWFTLASVTLTNTSQLYFDVSAVGLPARLYRLTRNP